MTNSESTKQVGIKRFPVALYERLAESAKRNRRPVTQEIIHGLEVYLSLKPQVEYIIEPQREEEKT